MKICPKCKTRFQSSEWRCPDCDFQPEIVAGFPSFAPDLASDDNSFNEASFARLSAADEQYFWFRARRRLLIWTLSRYFPRMQSYLEVGCGAGYVLAGVRSSFPAAALAGSELIAAGLPFAATRLDAGISLFQMDARMIPYEHAFEVVGAFDVLEHVQEDELVLAELYRACRSGGGILLTVPQHPSLWSRTDDAAHHVRRYVAADLRAKVERAGFTVLLQTSFVTLLLPLIIARRWSTRHQQNYSVSTSELALPGWMNWALERVLDVEQMLIRCGVRLPVGASLLMVAAKR